MFEEYIRKKQSLLQRLTNDFVNENDQVVNLRHILVIIISQVSFID